MDTQTPLFDQLSFMQRMAVRHAVFKEHKREALTSEPGALQKALETIASDPKRLQNAADEYGRFAKEQSKRYIDR